jgi:hypothetical protein
LPDSNAGVGSAEIYSNCSGCHSLLSINLILWKCEMLQVEGSTVFAFINC